MLPTVDHVTAKPVNLTLKLSAGKQMTPRGTCPRMNSSLTATGLLRSQNSIDLRQPTTDKCINDNSARGNGSQQGSATGFWTKSNRGPPPWTELQWVTLRNVIELAEAS